MLRDLQQDFARALFAPRNARVLQRIAADGLDPARRLFVHYSTVAASLARALETTYPALVAMLGPDRFRRAAARHIRQSPPASAALLHYGAGFGVTAAACADDLDAALVREVGAIEWARKCAFHAADAPVLTRAALGELAAEALPALRFARHPALHLVATATDAIAAWRAALAMPGGHAGAGLAVTRPALDVQAHALAPGAFALVAALADGATLERAAETAAAADPGLDLQGAIGQAVDIGAFTAFHA